MDKDKEDDIDRRAIERTRFRVDTGVNIAHILTTLGMLVMLFSWGSERTAIDAIHSTEINNIKEDRIRTRTELLAALQEINRKLDKIQSERKPKQRDGLVDEN